MILFWWLSLALFSFIQKWSSLFSLLFEIFFIPSNILFEIFSLIGVIIHIEQMIFIGDFVHLLFDEVSKVTIWFWLKLCWIFQLWSSCIPLILMWVEWCFLNMLADTWKCKSGSLPDLIFESDFFIFSVIFLSKRGSFTWLKWLKWRTFWLPFWIAIL